MKFLNFLKTIWWNSFISQTIENVPWQYWPIWQKFTWNTTLFAFWSPKANSETKRQKIDPKVPNRPPRKGLQTGHWQNPGSYSKKRIFAPKMAKIRPGDQKNGCNLETKRAIGWAQLLNKANANGYKSPFDKKFGLIFGLCARAGYFYLPKKQFLKFSPLEQFPIFLLPLFLSRYEKYGYFCDFFHAYDAGVGPWFHHS